MRLETPALVRAIRTRAGISQEELARRLDVSFASVNAWERGRTDPRPLHRARLDAMAADLGVRQALRVLVVDDDPEVCRFVAATIPEIDPRAVVTVATSGADGLLACGRVVPDLVLLDLTMPGLDGLEAAAAMGRVEELRSSVLVYLAPTTGGLLRGRAERVAAAVATTPLTVDDLAELLALVDDVHVRRIGDLAHDRRAPRAPVAGGTPEGLAS